MWTLGVEGQFYLLMPVFVLGLVRLGRDRVAGDRIGSAFDAVASDGELLLAARTPLGISGGHAGCHDAAATACPAMAARGCGAGRAGADPLCCRRLRQCHAVARLARRDPVSWHRRHNRSRVARGALVGGLLSLAPMRFVGRISYSLTLWHWPVIVLLLLGGPAGELDGWLRFAAIAIGRGATRSAPA